MIVDNDLGRASPHFVQGFVRLEAVMRISRHKPVWLFRTAIPSRPDGAYLLKARAESIRTLVFLVRSRTECPIYLLARSIRAR